MLEHVMASQTRFMTPGLAPDARGVALGRFAVVLLPSLDRVVGFFRGLSERSSLDDLLAHLRIVQVRTPLESREFVVELPVASSHATDGISAVAALMGGLTFTGTSKHFVKYRDGRSPLGYDVDSLHAGQGDFILYDVDFVQAYAREREIPFAQLALQLSPQREREDRLQPSDQALLRVAPGLWRAVVVYLHRSGCPCEVAACERAAVAGGAGGRADAAGERAARFYLVRCRIEPRMEGLFRRTPGIELHRMVAKQVAVEIGYRHPLTLGSCSSIFDETRFYLYSGSRGCLDILAASPSFVSAAAIVDLAQAARPVATQSQLAVDNLERVGVPLKLVLASGARRAAVAARIPIARVEWLKKLVYLLPPPALEGCALAIGEEWIYLASEHAIEYIPIGELYHQVAPGVLVPVGFELLPHVHPEVLTQHLGGSADKLIFFTPESPQPLLLERSRFTPLGRRALAAIEVARCEPQPAAEAPATSPSLCNDPAGLFPLWSFDAGAGRRGEG
jgi:hypothetical protein